MSSTLIRLARLGLLVLSLVAVAVATAVAATPRAGHWRGKVTKGQAVRGKGGEPTFTVSGSKLRKFTIGGVGAYCFTGYQVVSVYVPSARIHHGRFSTTYHPVKDANVKLTGRFVSASKAIGTVTGSGYACDYTIGFVAHPA
jgi:opacity protein-like surface antigen